MAIKVPARANDTSLTAQGVPSEFPAGNFHNGAETQIDRNPVGAPQLVNASVPLNDTVSFGDDFNLANPPYDYKRGISITEQDFIVYDGDMSESDKIALGNWLGITLIFTPGLDFQDPDNSYLFSLI